MRTVFLAICCFIVLPLQVAAAQTSALKSFAYQSDNCINNFLYFSNNWQINASNPPGAGSFLTGNFWVRAISLAYFNNGGTNDWAVVGHSGPNGDWITPPAIAGRDTVTIVYPADTAPKFTAGEYFDVHTGSCSGGEWGFVTIWYVPAS